MVVKPTNATPAIDIDWFADGDFTDTIDSATDDVLGNPGVTVEYGRDTIRSTAPPMIGAADFTLWNENREYSPENPATARYQFVKPGRPVRIQTTHGTSSPYREHTPYRENDPYRGVGVYPLFLGNIDTLRQNSEIGNKTVEVTALGTVAQLKRRIVSVALQGPIRTDVAVALVLHEAGWPLVNRNIAISDSQIRFFWVDERPAWDVLVELCATEGPGVMMYEDGFGVLHWENRNFRTLAARSLTSQVTLRDTIVGSDLTYTGLTYDPRWEDVVNRVTASLKQRAAVLESVVWRLGTTLTASATPRVIWARPSDPFINAVTPVETTDYTVSGGTVSITLEWTNGAVAKINVVATSGSPVISNLQLRATPYEVVGETQFEASVAATTDDEEKTMALKLWPELDPEHAQAICDSYLARYQDSRPIITVTFQNADGETQSRILRLRPSDRIRIVNTHLGIDVEVWVERIRHEITTGGRHQITISCEPVASIGSGGGAWDSAIWDTSVWGI